MFYFQFVFITPEGLGEGKNIAI